MITVLGYSSSGDLNPLLAEHTTDMFIGEWELRILLPDDSPNGFLDLDDGNVFPVATFHTNRKKLPQLEDTLLGVSKLVGDYAANGGGMNPELFGNVLNQHWLQVHDSLFQESMLTRHNGLTNTVDCLFALIDALEQFQCRSKTLL